MQALKLELYTWIQVDTDLTRQCGTKHRNKDKTTEVKGIIQYLFSGIQKSNSTRPSVSSQQNFCLGFSIKCNMFLLYEILKQLLQLPKKEKMSPNQTYMRIEESIVDTQVPLRNKELLII